MLKLTLVEGSEGGDTGPVTDCGLVELVVVVVVVVVLTAGRGRGRRLVVVEVVGVVLAQSRLWGVVTVVLVIT